MASKPIADSREDSLFHPSRFITEACAQLAYAADGETEGLHRPLKGLHFGQRKLLLSEIEFLSTIVVPRLTSRPAMCVYAGAANGSHLPFLFELFPGVRWVLIDPAPFCAAVHAVLRQHAAPGSDTSAGATARGVTDEAGNAEAVSDARVAKARRVEGESDSDATAARTQSAQHPASAVLTAPTGPIAELINGFCTPDVCARLRETYGVEYELYFISDLRSGAPVHTGTNREATTIIVRDNQLQWDCAVALRAEAAMLKFHPPYPACQDPLSARYDPADDTPASIEYVRGVLLFGVWAPKSSTEVRLIVDGPIGEDYLAHPGHTATYDCTRFERQLYWYNAAPEGGGRYARDVAAERLILARYVAGAAGAAAPAAPAAGSSQACGNGEAAAKAVDALSARMSLFLGFPLFTPLQQQTQPPFTEDDARLCALLYDARRERLFPHLRGLRVADVQRACAASAETKSEEGRAAGAAAADAVPAVFWSVATEKRLAAFYSTTLGKLQRDALPQQAERRTSGRHGHHGDRGRHRQHHGQTQ